MTAAVDDRQAELEAVRRQIRDADRDYEKALRHPRGEGLAETGVLLQRLYAREKALEGR